MTLERIIGKIGLAGQALVMLGQSLVAGAPVIALSACGGDGRSRVEDVADAGEPDGAIPYVVADEPNRAGPDAIDTFDELLDFFDQYNGPKEGDDFITITPQQARDAYTRNLSGFADLLNDYFRKVVDENDLDPLEPGTVRSVPSTWLSLLDGNGKFDFGSDIYVSGALGVVGSSFTDEDGSARGDLALEDMDIANALWAAYAPQELPGSGDDAGVGDVPAPMYLNDVACERTTEGDVEVNDTVRSSCSFETEDLSKATLILSDNAGNIETVVVSDLEQSTDVTVGETEYSVDPLKDEGDGRYSVKVTASHGGSSDYNVTIGVSVEAERDGERLSAEDSVGYGVHFQPPAIPATRDDAKYLLGTACDTVEDGPVPDRAQEWHAPDKGDVVQIMESTDQPLLRGPNAIKVDGMSLADFLYTTADNNTDDENGQDITGMRISLDGTEAVIHYDVPNGTGGVEPNSGTNCYTTSEVANALFEAFGYNNGF